MTLSQLVAYGGFIKQIGPYYPYWVQFGETGPDLSVQVERREMDNRIGSMRLLGSQLLSLDSKNRFTLPVMFQRQLEQLGSKRFYVTYGQSSARDYRYLEIWPDVCWENRVEELMDMVSDEELDYWLEYYIEPASAIGVDKQWRMVLLPHLRGYLGALKNDNNGDATPEETDDAIYMIGSQTHLRLYRWKEYMTAMERQRRTVPAAETNRRIKAQRQDRAQLVEGIRRMNRELADKED